MQIRGLAEDITTRHQSHNFFRGSYAFFVAKSGGSL